MQLQKYTLKTLQTEYWWQYYYNIQYDVHHTQTYEYNNTKKQLNKPEEILHMITTFPKIQDQIIKNINGQTSRNGPKKWQR
jgi:hypothetical protein